MKYEQGPNGFNIYLKSKGLVHMSKGGWRTGYTNIVMHEIDYIKGYAPKMIEEGITLTKEAIRKIEREYDAKNN